MKNLLEEMGETTPSENRPQNNVWFKQSNDLENQAISGFLVKDSLGEGFFYRWEYQDETEGKSRIVTEAFKGAKKVYYIQLLIVKSPNDMDKEQVRIIKLTPTLIKDLITQLKGDFMLGLEELKPYEGDDNILITLSKSGRKLNTKYNISVIRNHKVQMPKLWSPIEDFEKLLGLKD